MGLKVWIPLLPSEESVLALTLGPGRQVLAQGRVQPASSQEVGLGAWG